MGVTVHSNSKLISARAHAACGRAVEKTSLDLAANVRQNITSVGAVDTGNMLGSVAARQTGALSAEVEVGAEYAIYVEMGHHTRSGSFVPGRPFFLPAITAIRPRFEAAVRRAMSL